MVKGDAAGRGRGGADAAGKCSRGKGGDPGVRAPVSKCFSGPWWVPAAGVPGQRPRPVSPGLCPRPPGTLCRDGRAGVSGWMWGSGGRTEGPGAHAFKPRFLSPASAS